MKGTLLLGGLVLSAVTILGQAGGEVASVESQRAMVDEYCVVCHDDALKSGGFSWTEVDLAHPGQNTEQAEKIIRKLRSGMMPPPGAPRPDPATLKELASALETRVDAAAAGQPHIDAPELHRVNRSEYRNSVRDLLGLDLDITSLLPRDASTAGFDNMADALGVTPALMQGYIRAAETISRIAVGDPEEPAAMVSYNVRRCTTRCATSKARRSVHAVAWRLSITFRPTGTMSSSWNSTSGTRDSSSGPGCRSRSGGRNSRFP